MISSFKRKLSELSKRRKDIFFVQIGANDGVRADPIYNFVKKYHWRGVLVEPMEEYFLQLIKNYSGEKQLIFENVAISKKKKIAIYCIKKDSPWPFSYFGKTLSTPSKQLLEKNLWFLPGFKKYLTRRTIRSLSLKNVLNKHKVKSVDLLIIDTEGYDFEVLKQVEDLSSKPRFVYYEHKHLSAKDTAESWNLLQSLGYKVERGYWNTFAYATKR